MIPVAVTQRIDHLADRGETRDALDQALVNLLAEIGLLAMPVPNGLIDIGELATWVQATNPKGIVLSGGGDIEADCPRAKTELFLMDHAEQLGLPLWGICRGMQAMALRRGATLKPVTGHVRTMHQLSGAMSHRVNSFHDFAIDSLPTGFNELAASEDGVIEAIGHQSLPWQGWMWHPERQSPFDEADKTRLKALFKIHKTD